MREYSLKVTQSLEPMVRSGSKPQKSYMLNRKALVDWLSGVGDSLHISNQAIHHAALVLDVYISREKRELDIWLSGLCALLVSAKFVQMKYPSADSLNSATNNAYSFDLIVQGEAKLLQSINWELLQYPVFEFVNFFLAQGCLFPNDKILHKPGASPELVQVTIEHASNLRKYAEFFTDFCVQESELVPTDALITTCAILAFTRKHLNIKVIWSEEMTMLTSCSLYQIKGTLTFIEKKYQDSFPDHAKNQERIVAGRQKLEN